MEELGVHPAVQVIHLPHLRHKVQTEEGHRGQHLLTAAAVAAVLMQQVQVAHRLPEAMGVTENQIQFLVLR